MKLSTLFTHFFVIFICLLKYVQCINETKFEAPQLPSMFDADGNIKFIPRIVGGYPAKRGEYLGAVSIQNRHGQHFCGGTWVNFNNKTNYVLTAAHCVYEYNKSTRLIKPTSIQVMGDDLYVAGRISSSRQVQRVRRVVPHQDYNRYTMENDIAVLVLSASFKKTGTFSPFSLPNVDVRTYMECSVAGWGSEQEGGSSVPNLLGVKLNVISQENCRRVYGWSITDSAFCAGVREGGKDSCQGDSGGGMFCNGSLNGIVSYGRGCAKKEFPGVYTDVYYYKTWIETNFAPRISLAESTILLSILCYIIRLIN